jgi:outer membrane biosynthesis protein TonB
MFTAPVASKDPQSAPPPHREGPDFYDARHWESAYRHFDENAVPQILLFLQDDLARSRRREAAWLSVIAHLFVVILLVNQPYLMKFFPTRQLTFVPMKEQTQETPLFLDLPPSPKPAKPPNTNNISDQDRIATSKSPRLDPKELRKILDSSRPGRPGPQAQPSPQQAPAQQAAQASPAPQGQPQQQQGQPEPPQQNTNQMAQLQTPPAPPARRASPSVDFKTGGYVGSQINQAANAAAQNRNVQGGDGGNFGTNLGNGASAQGGLEVLSDTMGVDFGPYLARVLQNVRENWYNLIPEVARPPLMKKGKLAIEFAITKDGSVAGMRLVATSNDVALDRAAWGGITASNPFPPLPSEFKGQYLALRFYFYYNPDRNDMR